MSVFPFFQQEYQRKQREIEIALQKQKEEAEKMAKHVS